MLAADEVGRRRDRWRTWIALASVLAGSAACVSGCKKDHPDTVVPRAGSLADYEALLAHNAAELEAAGIVVARADAHPTSPATPGAATPERSYAERQPEDAAPEAEATDELAPSAPEAPPSQADGHALPAAPTVTFGESKRRSSMDGRARKASTRCERICELAQIACELEARICDLAEGHPDDPRYAQACTRAADQCEVASQACTRCN